MIKTVHSDGEKKIITLGLSWENLKRLKGGQPILIDGADIGVQNIEIFIFSGINERKMAERLTGSIGPKTKIIDNLRPS